jgi:hypothetical protein
MGVGASAWQPRPPQAPDRTVSLVVPLHREFKRGTMAGILRDAGVDGDELRRLL